MLGLCLAAATGTTLWLKRVESCDQPPGPERDQCLVDRTRALRIGRFEEIVETVSQIEDPVYRQVAISSWTLDRRDELTVDQASRLCMRLPSTHGQKACMRPYTRAHLQGEDRPPVKRGESADEIVVGGSEQCRGYEADPQSWAACRVREIREIPTLEQMMPQCTSLGSFEHSCRMVWIRYQNAVRARVPLEHLLTACPTEDCRFAVLDGYLGRKQTGIDTQLGLCIDQLDRYERDCVLHTMQRWWLDVPDWGAVRALERWTGPYPEEIGMALGDAAACQGMGQCQATLPAVREACLMVVQNIRAGVRQCPRYTLPDVAP